MNPNPRSVQNPYRDLSYLSVKTSYLFLLRDIIVAGDDVLLTNFAEACTKCSVYVIRGKWTSTVKDWDGWVANMSLLVTCEKVI